MLSGCSYRPSGVCKMRRGRVYAVAFFMWAASLLSGQGALERACISLGRRVRNAEQASVGACSWTGPRNKTSTPISAVFGP